MKANIINFKDQNFARKLDEIVRRNSALDHNLSVRVAEIIESVRSGQDEAIIKICNQYDNCNFKKPADLVVSESEIAAAKKNISPELLSALKLAYKRIFSYHKKQLPRSFEYKDKTGIVLGNKWRAVSSVAVYVPGGLALYPSSVLMSAIPAMVAGVKDIVIATPSHAGKIAPVVLAAADLCGIKTIYKMGGAASIAALALGTKTVKKVDKIVGPGNSFVALAKKQLFGEVGIDMIAGPTDILIIADNKTNPDWIAADLLSQLEHGIDSRAVLVTDNAEFAAAVNNSIATLAQKISRKNIIEQSLKNNGLIIIVKNLSEDGVSIANQIAPEHLEIITKDAKKIVNKITNAGAIFIGKYTPEAIGDYIAGPSHTLPTMGTARFSSGLSVFDFLKRISIISCSKEGFKKLQEPTALIADSEGFEAHKLSITIRNN